MSSCQQDAARGKEQISQQEGSTPAICIAEGAPSCRAHACGAEILLCNLQVCWPCSRSACTCQRAVSDPAHTRAVGC